MAKDSASIAQIRRILQLDPRAAVLLHELIGLPPGLRTSDDE